MIPFETYEPFDNTRGRNDRYSYAKVKSGGREYFHKKVKLSPDLEDNITREIAWSEFMASVNQHFPDVGLRGPAIADSDTDSILMEYIDAPHLADDHNLRDRWIECIPRYAQMLYVLDQAAEGWSTEGGSIVIDYGRHRTENAFDIWHEWLGENTAKVERLDEAKLLVSDYRSNVMTRMQHGDLTPWQIFDDDGIWIIYDGEKCGTDLARYNDLAYGYGRLFTLLRSRDAASNLLNTFMEIANVDKNEFTSQFLPVMTGRAVGMLSDALHDRDKNDYVGQASLLLDLCLTRDIDQLR